MSTVFKWKLKFKTICPFAGEKKDYSGSVDISFASIKERNAILKAAKVLQNNPDCPNLYLNPDETAVQLQLSKLLRAECKRIT